MNDTTASDPGSTSTLAADRHWQDDFIVGLRLRDVPPELIADQLALVRAHCAESGEGAREAFGDPTAYAATVAEGAGLASGGTGVRDALTLLPVAAGGFIGARLSIDGLLAVLRGDDVTVGLGPVLGAAVLLASVFVVLRLLRAGRALWTAMAVTGAAVGAAVLLDVTVARRLAELPGWPVLVLGVLTLVAVVVASRRSSQRQRLVDPVTAAPMR